MPTEIIVIAIVISVFCTFAGALYWGDLQTRRPRQGGRTFLAAMTSQPRPRIQHCPLCGVAMLGSKSSKESQQFDTFACLRCETTVTFTPPPEGSKPER